MVAARALKGDLRGTKNFCYGLPGNDNILGDFDPLGFTKDATEGYVLRLREAELAHGRVGMLAAAGFLVQEKFHPLFSADGGPAIDQIPKLPIFMWVSMTMGIAAAEAFRIQAGWRPPKEVPKGSGEVLEPGYYPGDLGFDPLGIAPTDAVEFRWMQEKELSHCRLGMIAAAGFLAQEAVSDSTWGTYWGISDY
jgi:hypothetical protein